MAQTPYHEVVSNISTYIPNWILEKLPHFIQDQNFDFYSTILAIGLFVILFVPLKECFQKAQLLVKNLKKYCIKNQQNDFNSLHDAIAKIIQQLDINQLWKDYRFDDYTIYPYLKFKQCSRFELLVIFTLIREGKLILYAHKIIDSGYNCIDTSHLPLQQVPKEFFTTSCDIYNENRWLDNYSIICRFHGGYEYINISVKSSELNSFIKQHKLTP
jgi:hypothetical protein